MILSEFAWFNSIILRLTVSGCIFLFFFSDKNLSFVGQLSSDNGNIQPWKDIKSDNGNIKPWKDIKSDNGNTKHWKDIKIIPS